MTIKAGDVLFRFLPEYQVWHVGIVVKVNKQHIDHIHVLEFDDSNCISMVTLRNYVWFRKYFWVAQFQREMDLYGAKAFRSRRERIRTAYELHISNNLHYTLHRYNCEYYARRCVFENPILWASEQTLGISESRFLLYSKVVSIALFNVVCKFHENLEYEKNKLNHEIGYVIDNKGNCNVR